MWLGCQICSKTLRQGCTFLSSRFRGSSTGHFSNFKVKKWGKIPLLPKRQKYEWVVWSLMSQTPLLFYSWTAAVSHFLVVLFRPLRSDPGSVNIYDSRKWKKAWLWERFVHFWLTAAISKEGVRFFFIDLLYANVQWWNVHWMSGGSRNCSLNWEKNLD